MRSRSSRILESSLLATSYGFVSNSSKRVKTNLGVLAVNDILSAVKHVVGDRELAGVRDDSLKALNLFGREFTGALLHVNTGLLADDV